MPFKRDSQTQAGKHLSGWGKGEAVLRVLRSTALRAFISWNASLPSMMTFSIEDTKQTWTSLKSLCIPKKLKRKQTSTNKYKRVWSPCVIQRVIDSKQSGQECWIRQQCSCGFKVVVSSVRMTGLKQPPTKKTPPQVVSCPDGSFGFTCHGFKISIREWIFLFLFAVVTHWKNLYKNSTAMFYSRNNAPVTLDNSQSSQWTLATGITFHQINCPNKPLAVCPVLLTKSRSFWVLQWQN